MTKIKKIDYPDKEVYIGEVDKDGIPHGNGKYIFPNGDIWIGESWHGERPDGFGVFFWSDGSTYAGGLKWFNKSFNNHGFGVHTEMRGKDTVERIGNWKNNSLHGKGKVINSNGSLLEGEFKDGFMHGHGIEKKRNGEIYEGEFKKDKYHGKGTYTYPDGRKVEGVWKDGGIIK